MEQRPLRLGDILDDYCPRERRVTNHAVVAMIEDTVKQTRCTTCDAEHPYKGGQAPRRRRKPTSAALYKEVLAGKPDTPEAPAAEMSAASNLAEASAGDDEFTHDVAAAESNGDLEYHEADAQNENGNVHDEEPVTPIAADADAHAEDERVPDVEDGPVHRPLIRATLPRPEGQKDVRTPPDFTIRQAGGRGGSNTGNSFFRPGNPRMKTRGGGQGGNGHRPQGGSGGGRFAGTRTSQGRGQGGGFRSAQPPRHGGGRKRSR
jgi:hypothetical protein